MGVLPELSRIVDLEKIVLQTGSFHIEASQEEKDALCKRFNLISIDSFSSTFEVQRQQENVIDYKIDGHLKAHLVQECVSTLKPVPEVIDIQFEFRVLHKSQEQAFTGELETEEDIEFSQTSEIDIGEITAQYLSLSLNPYPRVSEDEANSSTISSENKLNPFSILKTLKKT